MEGIKSFFYWAFTIFGTFAAGLALLLEKDAEGARLLDNPFGYLMLFVAVWNALICAGAWKPVKGMK